MLLTRSMRHTLLLLGVCFVLCSGSDPSELESGEELEDFEIADEELEKLPEEDETQTLHYRFSDALNGLLQNRVTREELLDLSSILRRAVADPLTIEDVNIDQQDMFNSIQASFREMRVEGLRGVRLDEVTANMSSESVGVRASIPSIVVTGNYNLSATLALFSLEGADKLLLNITDLRFSAVAHFNQASPGTLQIEEINATVKADTIDLQLFGLPTWGSSLINMCSEIIFENMKDSLLEDFRSGFKERANAELKKIKIPLNIDQDERLIDALLANANEQVRLNKKEPLKLPPFIRRLKQDLLLMSFQSETRLVRGVLSGLSTMRRTGDVTASYANGTFSLIAHAGFDRLTGSYDWYAHMMGLGTSGTAEVTVDDIGIRLEVILRVRRRARFVIRSLKMHSIGAVDVSVSGLGSGDPATEVITNFLGYAFRQQMADWLLDSCRKRLQNELDKVQIHILH